MCMDSVAVLEDKRERFSGYKAIHCIVHCSPTFTFSCSLIYIHTHSLMYWLPSTSLNCSAQAHSLLYRFWNEFTDNSKYVAIFLSISSLAISKPTPDIFYVFEQLVILEEPWYLSHSAIGWLVIPLIVTKYRPELSTASCLNLIAQRK